jgi:hypothetical protein
MYSGVPHIVHVLIGVCARVSRHQRREGGTRATKERKESALVGDDFSETEIGELDVSVAVEEQILGLEVAMGDV